MTKPLYDQPPTPNDGHFYPLYAEFYDLNSADHSAAAACGGGGGGGGVAGGQLHPELLAMSQAEGGYPPGWDYGLVDVDLSFPPSPGIIGGGEHVLQPQMQAPWDCVAQTYSATTAMASPMSQYVPVEESMGGFYEPPRWPPPPPGQISPSPSQSSYYAPSPVSGGGAQFSRHNSCSSIPAPLAGAVEQTRFDARFQPVHEQAPSPGRGRSTPGGTAVANGLHPGAESSPSADRKTDPRGTIMTTTTTTDTKAGTLSPAITPSPEDSTAAVPSQPAPQSTRRPSDQQMPKSSGVKTLLPARWSAQDKQQATTTGAQGQKQAQTQPRPQAQPESQSQPARPTQRTRNRAAANKCRTKTKLAMADLESTERAMSSAHQALAATARGLRDEVLLLKNEVLAHGNCDDTLIQQYLTAQARKVGENALQVQQDHDRHQYQHH